MASPFAMFRRNQQTLLVVLFILAIFAFTLSDLLTQRTVNLPMLGLIIGTCLLTAVGVKLKQPAKFAAIGAFAGLVIGFIASLAFHPTSPDTVAKTSIGNISRIEEENLLRNRGIANQFVQYAVQKLVEQKKMDFQQAGQQVRNYSFGIPGANEREQAVFSYLMLEEAKQLGIYIDKDAVSMYIDRLTDEQLYKDEYQEILHAIGITDSRLYLILQEQITIRTALQRLAPNGFVTPEQYWDIYKKLNFSQKIQSVAVPVDTLAATVPAPDDSELQAFFEEHKNNFRGEPNPESVGFRQPRKIQLAYIEANYLDLEPTVEEITDEEIEAYYEENKDPLYLNRRVPDGSFGNSLGTGGGTSGPDLLDPNRPTPRIDLDSLIRETPPGPDSPLKADKPDSGEPKSDDESGQSPGRPQLPQLPQQDEDSTEPRSQSRIDRGGPALQQVAFVQDESESKPEKPPADGSATSEKTEPKPAEGGTKDSESEAESSESKSIPPAPETDLEAPLKAPRPEPPKFKPLDDFLKDEIRDTLLRQRTEEKQLALATLVLDRMTELSDEYFDLEKPEQKKAFIERTQQELTKLADEYGLSYAQTPLMSAAELSLSSEHPIGSAAIGIERTNSSQETVTRYVFNLPAESVYEANAARSPDPNSIYVFWKTADRKEHIPEWDEEGIRDDVREAWRMEQGRPLAEQRAEELAGKLRDVDEPWSEYLIEHPETITGEKEGVLLQGLPSDSFTWLSTASVPSPLGIPMEVPELTDVSTVENEGPKFMETIFNDMREGDVAVVPNEDLSVYYVVQIRERRPSTPAEVEAQREVFVKSNFFPMRFMQFEFPTPYSVQVDREIGELYRAWLDDLKRKYKVEIFEREEERS